MNETQLIMKRYTIEYIGGNKYAVTTQDNEIDALVTFYKPFDPRNKAQGKGAAAYKHGLHVAASMYKRQMIAYNKAI